MTTGQKIRAARNAAHLTQKQLGELCGIAEPTIRRYELDKLNPKKETLEKIALPLGVHYLDLYGDGPVEQGSPEDNKLLQKAAALGALGAMAAPIDAMGAMYVNPLLGAAGAIGAAVAAGKILSKEAKQTPKAQVNAAMDKLNDEGQQKAVERVEELTEIPRYQATPAAESPSPAPEGTDTTPTEKPPEGP